MAYTGLSADPDYRYSINRLTGDGTRVQWEISFAGGFIERAHVKAIVTDPLGNIDEKAIQWVSDSTIIINPPVPDGHELTVYRETPKTEPLADFQDGAVISEANLDRNAKQAVFVAAEAMDRGEGALSEIGPRAILVPVGEVAPAFPPRSRMLGRLVGVDLAGKIVPVGSLDGDGMTLDTSVITHEGSSLAGYLADEYERLALTGEEILAMADTLTTHGEQLIEQASSDEALTSRLDQLRTDHDTLVSVVDALEQITEGPEGLATLIQNEQSQRISGDQALAADIALIGARSGDNSAFVLDLDTVKVDEDESLADRLSWIEANSDTLEVQITDEQTARINGDAAEAYARSALAATLRDEYGAAVQSEANARVLGDAAEATAREGLASTLRGEITAAVASEATARVNGDAAEASARASLATTLRGETAALIATEQTARSNAISAEASARTTMGATLSGQITAQVQAEQTARVNGDNALAGTLALLGASAGGGTAFQLDINKVLVDGGVSFASRISGINASIGAVSTSVSNEATARADADNALAWQISTVNSTLGGHNASIYWLSETAVAHSGHITTLQAKWSLTLDVNGYVSGIESVNNGTSSLITLRADRLRLGAPDGSNVYPFEIVGNTVYIKKAVIKDAAIETLHLASGAVTNGSMGTTPATGALTTKADWTTIQSVAVTTTGGPVLVSANANVWLRGGVGYGGSGLLRIRLVRGATELTRRTEWTFGTADDSPDTQQAVWAEILGSAKLRVFSLVDAPPAGSHTYQMQVHVDDMVDVNGNVTASLGTGWSVNYSARTLVAMEFKR